MNEKELLARIEEAAKSGRTHLTLSGERISRLPEEIGRLSELTTLNLAGNQLTSLPEAIGELGNLKNLYVHRNQLTRLPAQISKLKRLEGLFISHNRFESLPGENEGVYPNWFDVLKEAPAGSGERQTPARPLRRR